MDQRHLDVIRICPNCGENYDIIDHIPYFLPPPCHLHRICRRCVNDILARGDGTLFVCPSCGEEHPTPYGVTTFQPNQYILSIIQPKNHYKLVKTCEEHGKPLEYYCDGSRCHTEVCLFCFVKNHQGIAHFLVDIRHEVERRVRIHADAAINRSKKTLQHPTREY